MKALQTIQKTFRIFQTLTKIAMIFSFVWAGLSALGLFYSIACYFGGTVVGINGALLYTLTEAGGLAEMIGVLLADTILALTDGILFVSALHYFKEEQEDGTPFTKQGAMQIKNLGIRIIVLPLVAAILVGVIYAIFGLTHNIGSDWSNFTSVTVGIILILASIVFRYGAELEDNLLY